MELKEYQELATATAEPRAYDLAYLIPGIVSEVGELLGQQAKAHWHGWETEKLQDALVLEYGDIAWLTAVLLKVHDTDNVPRTVTRSPYTPQQQLISVAHSLHLAWTWDVTDEVDRVAWIRGEARQMWRRLEHYCLQVTGSSFDTVLRANLDKLASRAQRNVLRGSGDYR